MLCVQCSITAYSHPEHRNDTAQPGSATARTRSEGTVTLTGPGCVCCDPEVGELSISPTIAELKGGGVIYCPKPRRLITSMTWLGDKI